MHYFTVYNIDDLRHLVDENMGHRQKEIRAADELVGTLATEFYEWLKAAAEGTVATKRPNAATHKP